MGLLEKLKLLFKARQPITDIITEIKGLKTGWKTWQFWTALLASFSTLIAALGGFLPATTILIATTAIALFISIYNLWRGAMKSQIPGQTPFLQTSEFWLSLVGCVPPALVALKTGGVDPKWLEMALSAMGTILVSLGAGQNLSGQQPGQVDSSQNPIPPSAPAGPVPK